MDRHYPVRQHGVRREINTSGKIKASLLHVTPLPCSPRRAESEEPEEHKTLTTDDEAPKASRKGSKSRGGLGNSVNLATNPLEDLHPASWKNEKQKPALHWELQQVKISTPSTLCSLKIQVPQKQCQGQTFLSHTYNTDGAVSSLQPYTAGLPCPLYIYHFGWPVSWQLSDF